MHSRSKRASVLATALLRARLIKARLSHLFLTLSNLLLDDAPSSPSAQPVGRFGVITGESYSSPRASRKKPAHAKLIKEPTDHSEYRDALTFSALTLCLSSLV